MRFIWVGVGGALGSMVRFGVGLVLGGSRFPWATLSVNIVGSFALGVVLTYALDHWPAVITTSVAVGLIGGFTTFSTFAWETLSAMQAGEPGRGLVYATVSVVGGLLAALAGYATGRALG